MTDTLLRTDDHSRDSVGMRYVYPVVSRRAGGVSIGINLNPNNACNWRCVYCQVPNLVRGGPPAVDLQLLERELAGFLESVRRGSFLARRVPEGTRLVDVAFSGNGEPTSAVEFPQAVEVVERVLLAHGLAGSLLVRLITNGSLMDRRGVQRGVAMLGAAPGEVWFKLDSATTAGLARINGTRGRPDVVGRRLAICTSLAPTWVQTCLFRMDQSGLDDSELAAYLHMLAPLAGKLKGVHLYGLARPSMQPEASRLSRLGPDDLNVAAEKIRALGLTVSVSP